MKKMLSILLLTIMLLESMGCAASESPTSGASSEAPDAQSSEPIVFGVATALTGNYAESGVMMTVGAKLAVDDINAAGGINGRQVKLKILDNKSDNKESPEVAKAFVEDENIMAVMGDLMSGQSMAAAPVYEAGGLVQLSPTSSASAFPTMGDYQFSVAGIATDEGPNYVEKVLVNTFDVKRFAIIYADTEWGTEAAQSIKDIAEEKGIEVVALESYKEGDKDFSSALSKIRQSNPDHLLLACQYTEGILIVNQIKEMGWDIVMSTQGSLTQPSFCDQISGGQISGIASAVFTEENPGGYEFAQRFKEHPESGGIEPSMRAAFSYDAIALLAKAASECGNDLTRANLRDKLSQISDFPAVAGGIISFEPEGYVHRVYTVVSIQDGVWAPFEQ